MGKFKTILFDVDETLLNFKKGQDQALAYLFRDQGVILTPELHQQYLVKNHDLWQAFERQEVSRDVVLGERFEYIFDVVGLKKDGAEMDHLFRSYLQEEAILLDGALENVQKLQQHHDLYIVTNGVSNTQARRLEKSGLRPYFKDVFVSDDAGYQKPLAGFFDYAFARIPEVDLASTMIIGDSLQADILGGNQAGITSCWYNPERVANTTGIQPTFEINHLDEISQLVD